MGNPALVGDVGTEIAALLKLEYAPAIAEQTKREPILLNKIGDGGKLTFSGDHYEGVARMGFAQSVGPRPLRTPLPVPVPSTDVRFSVFHKYNYATFDLTGPDLKRARDARGAFVVILTNRVDDTRKALLKDINWQSYLSGTGIYATITNVGGAANAVAVNRTKYLRTNRRLDVWDDGGVLLFGSANSLVAANYLQVTGIDGKTKIVSFNNNKPAGIAVGDGLVPEVGLPTGGAAVGIFINGLEAMIDDGTAVGTYEGISRTTYPQWRSTIFDSAGLMSLQLLQKLCDVPKSISGEEIDTLWCSPNARNLYLQLLTAQKRFMAEKADGGYTTVEFNQKKIYVDDDCPDDIIYAFVLSLINKTELQAPEFASETGEILKWNPLLGDTLTAYMRYFGNLYTDQANAHGKAINLPVDNDYLINPV